jgi:hypothetical protein
VCWYVDVLGFCLFRIFPVGVAKYLADENVSWSVAPSKPHENDSLLTRCLLLVMV